MNALSPAVLEVTIPQCAEPSKKVRIMVTYWKGWHSNHMVIS